MYNEVANALLEALKGLGHTSKRRHKKNIKNVLRLSDLHMNNLSKEIEGYLEEIERQGFKLPENKGLYELYCIFPFIRLSMIDLHILNYYLADEKNEIRRKYLVRAIGLNIYEFCQEVDGLFGKKFRIGIKALSNYEAVNIALNKLFSELRIFKRTYLNSLRKIRNFTIAHRDKDIVEQMKIVNSIGFEKEALSFMILTWFEDFKKLEKLMLEGLK